MKLSRRGLFGAIAGAAVAGPSVAQHAINSMTLDSSMAGLAIPSSPYSEGYGGIGGVIAEKLKDERTYYVDRLARMVGMTVGDHRDSMADIHISAIEPDLASMRSISLDSKIRIQRERTYWRQFNREKWELQRSLERLAARAVGLA